VGELAGANELFGLPGRGGKLFGSAKESRVGARIETEEVFAGQDVALAETAKSGRGEEDDGNGEEEGNPLKP